MSPAPGVNCRFTVGMYWKLQDLNKAGQLRHEVVQRGYSTGSDVEYLATQGKICTTAKGNQE